MIVNILDKFLIEIVFCNAMVVVKKEEASTYIVVTFCCAVDR